MTALAPTYLAPHWYTGIVKCRCAGCGKVVFATEQAAVEAAAKISERVPMFPYRGRCGHWHVTRRKPKEKKT